MKKNAAMIAAIIALMMAESGAWTFPNLQSTYSGTPLPVTIGGTFYEAPELIYIAKDQGYFAGNGLNVTVREYGSSLGAIDGLLSDGADIALASEYVVAGNAFEAKKVSAIGCIYKYQSLYIIGRKDRGIENISDLKGKKIGVTRRSPTEFHMGRFLDLHGMSIKDLTLVDLQPSQYVQAITNGSIDALIASSTYIDPINERLGGNTVLWPAQSSQPGYGLMVSRNDWIASHPEEINRLLKALAQAEEYSINHPEDAKAILQKRLNYTSKHIAQIWSEYQYSLMLDQSLLIAMNDEALWMIRNNLTNEKTLPDFSKYIYTQGLREAKPDAVNIR